MIEIRELTIRLPSFCIEKVCLRIPEGAFFIILGPTGAGKTLLIESIAGIVKPTAGSIAINGKNVTHLPPEKRHVGIVYQDYALFPHLSVLQNIRYGLRYRSEKKHASQKWVEDLMRRMGIEHLRKRSVKNLSGGECQRVALARALAANPSVLLLDEPLSALDPAYREEIQNLLRDIHAAFNTTIMMVTHDFREARYLGQHVAIIRNGRIEQEGATESVFESPATPFVHNFLSNNRT